jgi:hypothetical protein
MFFCFFVFFVAKHILAILFNARVCESQSNWNAIVRIFVVNKKNSNRGLILIVVSLFKRMRDHVVLERNQN